MNRVEELNAIVRTYDLNTHPFYQAWRMGQLPVEKLRDYAAEYGRFINTIDEGWDTIGMPAYAEEERVHEKLWAQFQLEIGCAKGSDRPQTRTLETAAREMFSLAPEAVGALYAFEAQQPLTSQSKLDGLNEHYSVSDAAKEYFVVHASDYNEVEDLKEYVAKMSDDDFARAKSACAVVCSAMWSALDGVYYN
jgi:pyrroloquinoline-quinone synthase